MIRPTMYRYGSSPALGFAQQELIRQGYSFTEDPEKAQLILLDVPNKASPEALQLFLSHRNQGTLLCGGNIPAEISRDFPVIDLLRDEWYLCENAAITAECAIQVAMERLPVLLNSINILLIGWGRIGKILAAKLQRLGCHVTIAVRKPSDQALIQALGYRCGAPGTIALSPFRLILNTAPAPIYTEQALCHCPDAVKIDLASVPGLLSPDVISAKGLPGRYAPESSGNLIAATLIRGLEEQS